MDPEGNRHHPSLNGNSRPTDARHTYSAVPHAHSSMLGFYNYILPPMSSMMYPPFGTPNLSWPNNNYFTHPSSWREAPYPLLNFPHDINASRNFYNTQNMRVIPRDMRQKSQSRVINLESDEEEQKQKIVLVLPIHNINKKSQKQAQVIQIDGNSDQKSQRFEPAPPVTKLDITAKVRKPQPTLQKAILHSQQRKKQKQLILENKTKQITKIKNKETKIAEKQQKMQKQRKRKIIQSEKVKLKEVKEDKQKQIEKPQKKKYQRAEKEKTDKNDRNERSQRNERNERNDRNDRNDKIQKAQKNDKNRNKPAVIENKGKSEEIQTKQIAKYMESHGQIRHGKEFQSDIPANKINNSIELNKWLQQKRRKLLKRQIGVLTY